MLPCPIEEEKSPEVYDALMIEQMQIHLYHIFPLGMF